MSRPARLPFVLVLSLAAAPVAPAAAQEQATKPAQEETPAPSPAAAPAAPPPKAWGNSTELAYVVISGNSESSTLGFKDTLTWKRDPSSFELKAAAVRVETTTVSRTVIAGPAVLETETADTTAENYNVSGRYDRKMSPKFFWFTGAAWDRNVFAGIDSRYVGFGGVGNLWSDTERLKFRTDYSLSYTKEDTVADVPGADDTFAGLRLTSTFFIKFNESTSYGNDTILDDNIEETSDWRGDMTNWVAVAMTRKLALKVSLRWLYDNEPAFTTVTDPAGLLPPALLQLDELDTIFTTSLVINL